MGFIGLYQHVIGDPVLVKTILDAIVLKLGFLSLFIISIKFQMRSRP
jgi:hypothetical protein